METGNVGTVLLFRTGAVHYPIMAEISIDPKTNTVKKVYDKALTAAQY